MSLFSEDCPSCLCGLPHSIEQHHKAVEQAANGLQYELDLLNDEIRQQDTRVGLEEEDFSPLPSRSKTVPALPPETRTRQFTQLPTTLDELCKQFDVELVTSCEHAPSEVYIFTFSRGEWERAKETAKDLLQADIITKGSFVELAENGFFGSFVGNLEMIYQGIAVEAFRDRAYRKQNSLE